MSTPRKSTSHTTPSTPRRPCTPEGHGRSPRAPGPPSSPDRRIASSPDRYTKSYLRPTVSSTLHLGSSTTQPARRSIDKPPFLPPSSVGVNSAHHKNPSSSTKGSLSLKGILTRATSAMKSGTGNRKSSTSAGINIGKGSGGNTPARPRSPAGLLKKKEGSRDIARSNSMPKKLGAVKKSRERDTLTISSIDDNLPEHLPDPVEMPCNTPEIVVQSTPPQVEPQEPAYTEKIEDNVHEGVIENAVAATEEKPLEENHKEVKVEEIEESSIKVDNVRVIEECREEQPKVEEEVKETPKDTEDVVIAETQEKEAPEVEAVDTVKELPHGTKNVAVVEEQEVTKPEEAVAELPKEPEEVVASVEEEKKAEEDKEEPKEPEEKEIIAESHDGPKEEVELQEKAEEEKPVVEPETKVEETPKPEENGTVEETSKAEEKGTVEETPQAEEKPIAAEVVEVKEEVVAETPKVEEKPVSTTVAEPETENVSTKKPDAVSTRREGAVSNDVIEETKSRLMEKRKNRVLALVGAFETVMHKPEEGSTRK